MQTESYEILRENNYLPSMNFTAKKSLFITVYGQNFFNKLSTYFIFAAHFSTN